MGGFDYTTSRCFLDSSRGETAQIREGHQLLEPKYKPVRLAGNNLVLWMKTALYDSLKCYSSPLHSSIVETVNYILALTDDIIPRKSPGTMADPRTHFFPYDIYAFFCQSYWISVYWMLCLRNGFDRKGFFLKLNSSTGARIPHYRIIVGIYENPELELTMEDSSDGDLKETHRPTRCLFLWPEILLCLRPSFIHPPLHPHLPCFSALRQCGWEAVIYVYLPVIHMCVR